MKQNTLDERLKAPRRSLRTLPGKLLLGPTGARLFADYLDEAPGFLGRLDFIHKLNLPGLFGLHLRGETLHACESVWYPSHSQTTYQAGGLSLTEQKYITWDDCAVSCVSWSNQGGAPRELDLFVPPEWSACGGADGALRYTCACATHGFQLICAVAAGGGLRPDAPLVLPPSSSGSFFVAAAVGEQAQDTWEALCARAAQHGASPQERLAAHTRRYEQWFDDTPRFTCDDPLLTKTWDYRWFLLRHNYASPRRGNLRQGLFYEGRSHKLPKAFDRVSGHEFAQLIPLSTPLHLMDARWKGGGQECREAILTLLDSADENGIFRTMKVDETGKAYGNFSVWAIEQAMLTNPDAPFVKQILPRLKQFVRGTQQVHCKPGDVLPVCFDHRLTGKEYQPSFWYFEGYPRTVTGASSFQTLKRVDLAVYHYLNAVGAANLCALVQDAEEAEFRALAQRICAAVLTRMWDKETGFFYDLHAETDEKARVKCVTGIDPLWACMPGVDSARLMETFLRADTFALGSGFASVARDCPVFTAQGGWNGLFFKGRNGCVWNGPSWPYTTGMALDALAQAERGGASPQPGAFSRGLREYALEHYRFGDPAQPYLVEHYDSITGEMLSDEPDYLHSYFIDLVVRRVAGVIPVPGGVRLAPVCAGLKRFCLSKLRVAGHSLSVSLQDDCYEAFLDGVSVCKLEKPFGNGTGELHDGIFVGF